MKRWFTKSSLPLWRQDEAVRAPKKHARKSVVSTGTLAHLRAKLGFVSNPLALYLYLFAARVFFRRHGLPRVFFGSSNRFVLPP
jgi:hypothetical protein